MDNIAALNTYIKTHDLSKYVKWAICATVVGGILLKMGLVHKIPKFILSSLSNVVLPSAQTVRSHLQSAGSYVKPLKIQVLVLLNLWR